MGFFPRLGAVATRRVSCGLLKKVVKKNLKKEGKKAGGDLSLSLSQPVLDYTQHS